MGNQNAQIEDGQTIKWPNEIKGTDKKSTWHFTQSYTSINTNPDYIPWVNSGALEE
jgi:hypothetical protein